MRTSSVNRSFTFVIIILYICTCIVVNAWNSNRTRKNNVLGTEHVCYLRFQLQKSFSVIADPQEISISQVFIFLPPGDLSEFLSPHNQEDLMISLIGHLDKSHNVAPLGKLLMDA